MKTKSILLLRHGETNWNIEQRFQGSRDLPLNEKGEEQARQVSLRIKSWHPEFVVSSPLMRAFKTSVLASGWHEESIKRDPDLCEINFGVWEGCSTHELKEQGELFSRWAQKPFSVPVPEAESETEILARVQRVIDKLVVLPHERILVVSHGGTLRALLSVALHIPLQSAWRFFRLSNCSLSGLEYDGERFILAFYNDHNNNCKLSDADHAFVPVTF